MVVVCNSESRYYSRLKGTSALFRANWSIVLVRGHSRGRVRLRKGRLIGFWLGATSVSQRAGVAKLTASLQRVDRASNGVVEVVGEGGQSDAREEVSCGGLLVFKVGWTFLYPPLGKVGRQGVG